MDASALEEIAVKSFVALAVVGLSMAMAVPAGAATTRQKSMMTKPSMEQCEGGYKRTYRQSMNWSRKKFKRACRMMSPAKT